jgi:hypothetical protein
MASTLISYTETYDVDVEYANMISFTSITKHLNDTPFLAVSP